MSQQDTITRLKQLRAAAKTTQTAMASALAATQHAERELSDARTGLETLDLMGEALDLSKKLGPQIDRLVAEAEQELKDAEGAVAEIDDIIRGPGAA